jgi:hypothetical protein
MIIPIGRVHHASALCLLITNFERAGSSDRSEITGMARDLG